MFLVQEQGASGWVADKRTSIPTDKGAASAGEHAALLSAIADAEKRGQNTFSIVELGAAWGPWISEAGVVCDRRGFERVNKVGVEAHRGHFDRMRVHMARNGQDDAVLLHGAVWPSRTTLKFPATDDYDYGAFAAPSSGQYRDSKRKNLDMVEVEAYTLPTIVDGLDQIDFMHWDIQGTEADLAEANVELLNERVRTMMIATHSRAIEGRLVTLFYENDWDIVHEIPCRFSYNRRRWCPEKMTTSDGILFARNSRFATQ